jgi:hypothetical protein
MTEEDHEKALNDYLDALDVDGLNMLLGKVLRALRSRENSQMRVDAITKSQCMRLQTRNLNLIRPSSRGPE